MRPVIALSVGALLVTSLAGCASQIDALGPVAGDTPAMIRTAAIDVLMEARLTIRQAPECTSTGDGWSCVGGLTDGSPVVVSAIGKTPTTMTVMVGDLVAYEGPIQEVLDRAAETSG